MDIKKLQEEFVGILANILASSTNEEIEKEKKRALEIINELKDHINDDIEYLGHKMTALSYVICFDSSGCGNVDGVSRMFVARKVNGVEKIFVVWRSGRIERKVDRLNNKTLVELETAIKKARGKLSSDKPISFLVKLSIYAILPVTILSFCSTLCFIAQSVVAGGDIRIAGYLSIFGLLVCIGLGSIVKKSGVLWEKRLRRIEEFENIQIEEESDKIVELYVNLSPPTVACLSVPSAFAGLVALVSFAVVLGKDITGNNAQIALSSFMFGALISVLSIGADYIITTDVLGITMGQLVDVTTGQQSITSVSMENILRRQRAS